MTRSALRVPRRGWVPLIFRVSAGRGVLLLVPRGRGHFGGAGSVGMSMRRSGLGHWWRPAKPARREPTSSCSASKCGDASAVGAGYASASSDGPRRKPASGLNRFGPFPLGFTIAYSARLAAASLASPERWPCLGNPRRTTAVSRTPRAGLVGGQARDRGSHVVLGATTAPCTHAGRASFSERRASESHLAVPSDWSQVLGVSTDYRAPG